MKHRQPRELREPGLPCEGRNLMKRICKVASTPTQQARTVPAEAGEPRAGAAHTHPSFTHLIICCCSGVRGQGPGPGMKVGRWRCGHWDSGQLKLSWPSLACLGDTWAFRSPWVEASSVLPTRPAAG